jgi:ATP-dependent Clp protease ATP-binding subunit ClpX
VITQQPLAVDLYRKTSHILGQEKARKQMAVLLERQKMVQEGKLGSSSGAVLAGRSGSGKTFLARTMCQISGLPFAEIDANHYTESGYAGLNLSQGLLPLLVNASKIIDRQHGPYEEKPDHNVLKRGDLDDIIAFAESGVVIVDEFDKWMHRRNHVTGLRDTPIQAEFLKMVEGADVFVSDDADELGCLVDTTRILFICAGAFVGLTKIVAKHLQVSTPVKSDETYWEHVEPQDFVAYGVLPELSGRLSTHIMLAPLRVEHLTDILSQPGGIIDEYRSRFEEVGVQWGVSESGIRQIANVALQRGTGARAVEHVCWQVFSEALFNARLVEGDGRVTLAINDVKARIVA